MPKQTIKVLNFIKNIITKECPNGDHLTFCNEAWGTGPILTLFSLLLKNGLFLFNIKNNILIKIIKNMYETF